MRFGGSDFCRQSFGASLRDLSLDKLGTSAHEKQDREPVERLKITLRRAERIILSKPLSSGARRSPQGGNCIVTDAISGLASSPISEPNFLID